MNALFESMSGFDDERIHHDRGDRDHRDQLRAAARTRC